VDAQLLGDQPVGLVSLMERLKLVA